MLYSVDSIVYLRGKFALHEELIVHYTFMVSSLCVRNLLYKFFRAKRLTNLALFSYPCVRNSCVFWHCLVIHMRGTLMCILFCFALFSYPYVRNSYVLFGTV